MMYKKELEITKNSIRNPQILIREEYGGSRLYKATQKLKLQLLNRNFQSTEQESSEN